MATKTSEEQMLPGEARPLAMKVGRKPITEDEALGVLRRLARVEMRTARASARDKDIPEELPAPDAKRTHTIFRISPRTMAFVKARAEAENTNVTELAEAFFTQYAKGKLGTDTVVPGDIVSVLPPRGRSGV